MTELPEWLATLVGRLVIENEMLRKAIAEQAVQPEAVSGSGLRPDSSGE